MSRKGIVLAGGSGTRLYPITAVVSKQLLPVYSKPMVYYPLSVLMLAGIREICIITSPADQVAFQSLLSDGSQFGITLHYEVQEKPAGIAQAFTIADGFLSGSPSALILGDNLFYGRGLTTLLNQANTNDNGATVFAYPVENPSAYGVVEIGEGGEATGIEEKPREPKSNLAVTGLYFYDGTAPERARSLKPSSRGELEITDLNRSYLDTGNLHVVQFGRGFAWLDTGTPQSLLQASVFVQAIEDRQGLMISCLEEIAYQNGWVTASQLATSAEIHRNSPYGHYLRRLLPKS
jgi:glucose-1-phosphate thymidylyltransferase